MTTKIAKRGSRPWGRTSLKWAGSLPEYGESSYCLVLTGFDKKQHTRIYGRRKAIRRKAIRSNITGACLRRYFLALGSREADKYSWAYPPGQLITAKPISFYTVFLSPRRPFASFIDAAEAFLFANSLRSFSSFNPTVYLVGG